MKKSVLVCLAVTLVAVLCFFTACETPPDFVNPGDYLGGGGEGEIADASTDTEKDIVDSVDKDFSDVTSNTDVASAVEINASDELVEITESGSYILSGSYTAGVSVGKKLDVHLFLNNAQITSSNSAALSSGKSTKLTITALAGAQNSISTAESCTENALHVKGTLTINGSGAISVTSVAKHGIKVGGALVVVDASITAIGKKNAVACGSLTASNARIEVVADKDGVNADCDFDNSDNKTDYEFTTEQGFVYLSSCTFVANVQGDGIQAETFVYIDGGDIDITTTAQFVAYSAQNMTEYDLDVDDFRYVRSGSSSYKKIASDERANGTKYAMTQSCKGIKVGEIEYEVEDENGSVTEITVSEGDYALVVDGGNIVINSDDDAMHVNGGNAFINGGTLTISTLDDGITADKLTRINDGTITVLSCYEGLEGAQVEIYGGTISITAEDDGINAASDVKNMDMHIIIGGGTVTVDAEGDGLDSNGSMLFTGGVITVFGPTRGGNAGLDADKGIVVNGGTLFASSTLGMVETPSSNSEQNVLSFAQNSSLSAGAVVCVKDKDGNELVSVTLAKSCQSVIISSSALVKGSEYTIWSDDTQLASFTVSSVITSVGSSQSGNRPGGGFGGFGGGGRR